MRGRAPLRGQDSLGGPRPRIQQTLRWAAMAAFVILSFVPFYRWVPHVKAMLPEVAPIPGHYDWFANAISGWTSGTVIVVGAAVVLLIFSRRWPGLWRDDLFGDARPWSTASWWGLVLGVAALAFYILLALVVFGRRPLVVDEIAQLVQARIFAGGHLWRPVHAHQEFFNSILMIDRGGHLFSQFPPGGPAMLALGELIRAPWLVGPICGAITVLVYCRFLQTIGEDTGVVIGATALLAFAPFTALMAASYMNHTSTLMWLMIGCAALATTVTRSDRQFWPACLTGLAFGVAATIRAPEAIAFAVPAGVWLFWLTVKRRLPVAALLGAGVGLLLPIGGLLWYNTVVNGAPLRFGYELQWGKDHGLGFHHAPWGQTHTPLRGLLLTNVYFLRLQIFLFEGPIPALLPATVAFVLTRRWRPFDRYLLISGAILVGLYFAYWFDGFWLGPRFYHPLIPIVALWTARLPRAVRERWGRGRLYRGVVYGGIAAIVIAASIGFPARAAEYHGMMYSMRWNPERNAQRSGVHDALVFVHQTWGAQLMVRMWGLDIPRPKAEFFYHRIDACVLETAIADLERHHTRDGEAARRLSPLVADSALLIGSPFSPDTSERYLPGTTYTPQCVEQARQDRIGTWIFPPTMLAIRNGNIYAHDLGAHDLVLAREYPDRPMYMLRALSPELHTPPTFVPLRRDSVLHAWAGADTSTYLAARQITNEPAARPRSARMSAARQAGHSRD